jgi:hypothetical protein
MGFSANLFVGFRTALPNLLFSDCLGSSYLGFSGAVIARSAFCDAAIQSFVTLLKHRMTLICDTTQQ